MLFDNVSQLSSVTEDINGANGSLIDTLAVVQNNLDSSAQSLKESSEYLAQLSSNIKTAVSSEDWQGLKQIFQTDPHELSQSLASPVQIERTALIRFEFRFSNGTSLYHAGSMDWIFTLACCG